MKRILMTCLLIAVLAFAAIATVRAQWGGGYDLAWSTIDNGGGESIGSGYTLAGTIGQLDASGAMTSGGFTLTGGFWSGINVVTVNYRVFLPMILR